MNFKTDDRVYETSLTTGIGDYTLDGAPVGFNTFAGMGANNTCAYYATDDTNWEIGIGTILTGPARLQRTTILRSSNANAAVNWGTGTRKIRCGLPAAMSIPRSLSKSVAGGVDVALTQDEQRRPILVFTGLLTANINVTVDTTEWEWTVYNNTTGAYTLTLKTTAGTGKAITQGKSTRLRCDGVNVVDAITMLTSLATGAIVATGSISSASDIGIASTQKIYLDGVALNGDTYLTESAANTLDVYAGGVKVATFGSSILTTPLGVKMSATAGDTAVARSKETSYTAAATGPVPSTNTIVSVSRIGNRVTLTFPTMRVNGNSSAAAIALTTLAAEYRPVTGVYGLVPIVTSAGSDQTAPGLISVSAAGVIAIYKDVAASNFASSAGTTGYYGFSITFLVA